jgi:hypothetical protein
MILEAKRDAGIGSFGKVVAKLTCNVVPGAFAVENSHEGLPF